MSRRRRAGLSALPTIRKQRLKRAIRAASAFAQPAAEQPVWRNRSEQRRQIAGRGFRGRLAGQRHARAGHQKQFLRAIVDPADQPIGVGRTVDDDKLLGPRRRVGATGPSSSSSRPCAVLAQRLRFSLALRSSPLSPGRRPVSSAMRSGRRFQIDVIDPAPHAGHQLGRSG